MIILLFPTCYPFFLFTIYPFFYFIAQIFFCRMIQFLFSFCRSVECPFLFCRAVQDSVSSGFSFFSGLVHSFFVGQLFFSFCQSLSWLHLQQLISFFFFFIFHSDFFYFLVGFLLRLLLWISSSWVGFLLGFILPYKKSV